MHRDDVLSTLRANKQKMATFGIKSLSLFGSVARDEAGAGSDLDLLVDFEGPATYDRYIGLKLFLEDLLGARVDLVMRSALKPRMLPSVEQDAVRVA